MAAQYNYNCTEKILSQSPTTTSSRARFSWESLYQLQPSAAPSSSISSITRSRGDSVSSQLSDTGDSEKQVYFHNPSTTSPVPCSPAPWQHTFYNSLNEKPLPPLPFEYGARGSGNGNGHSRAGSGTGSIDKPLQVVKFNKLEWEGVVGEVAPQRGPVVAELSSQNEGAWWI